MALTKVSRGLLSTGIVDNSNATAITIDSSENVGIGTGSPDAKLAIEATSQGNFTEAMRISNTGGGANEGNYIQFEISNTSGYGPRIGGRREGTGGSGLHFYTGENNAVSTEKVRIDHDGNVGIGTSSVSNPNGYGRVLNVAGFAPALVLSEDTGKDFTIGVNGNDLIIFDETAERMRIASNGWVNPNANVTGNPADSQGLHLGWNFSNGGGESLIVFNQGAGVTGGLVFSDNSANGTPVERMRIGSTGIIYVNGDGTGGRISGDGSGGLVLQDGNGRQSFKIMSPSSGSSQAMTLDASGNLLVGTTSTDTAAVGFRYRKSLNAISSVADGGVSAYFGRRSSDGDIVTFRKDDATVGSIGTQGSRLTIGNGDTGLRIAGDLNTIVPWNTTTNLLSDSAIDLGRSNQRFKDLYLSSKTKYQASGGNQHSIGADANDLIIRSETAGSETARFTYGGSVLVGKTAEGTGTDGIELNKNDVIVATRNNDSPLILNRRTSDGDIALFRKDNANVGSINSRGGEFIAVGSGDTFLEFNFGSNQINPSSGTAARDNAIDLGSSSARFDDIYATNGTIQTSDRNEKQDIAELSDAETAVAVACKGLLRKFRWKDSVAEKGDEARTHFGIIAQDLQAAFAAEGLDAGDYAMFISTTWTDEETNEEKTRMGVRYSELLAFIIAAI